jgi:uncharacterized protein YqjF (DUF2071 family)
MTGVRPVWSPPVWGLSSFHEVNVRTYVHNSGRDPGVWFLSLDAANAAAVWLARTFWKLPYRCARMNLEQEASGSAGACGVIEYRSERVWTGPLPAGCVIRYSPRGPVTPAVIGTLEYFLVERYILYTRSRSQILAARVQHVPYPLRGAEVLALDETLLAATGITRPDEPPLTHYADEVRVRVFPLRTVSET